MWSAQRTLSEYSLQSLRGPFCCVEQGTHVRCIRKAFYVLVQDYVRSRPENAELRSLGLKEFTGLIFASCPGLEPFRGSLEQIYAEFTEYKRTVPVRGAILLNSTMSKCLLVRGFKEGSGWGFPKGKLSLNETDEACAIREVFEETGYDITPKLDSKHFIELKIGNQATKLYIVVVGYKLEEN